MTTLSSPDVLFFFCHFRQSFPNPQLVQRSEVFQHSRAPASMYPVRHNRTCRRSKDVPKIPGQESLFFKMLLSLLHHVRFLVAVRILLPPTAILEVALFPLYVQLVLPCLVV